LAVRVGEPEPQMEAPVRERQRRNLPAQETLATTAVPAELGRVHGVARDEHARVVAELELEARRRQPVARLDAHAQHERLAGEELLALGAFGAQQLRRRDLRLA